MRHLPPKYYGYTGNFWNICVCKDCGLTGMEEDLYSSKPCPDCGGKLQTKVGRWDSKNKLWLTKSNIEKVKVDHEIVGEINVIPDKWHRVLLWNYSFGKFGSTFIIDKQVKLKASVDIEGKSDYFKG